MELTHGVRGLFIYIKYIVFIRAKWNEIYLRSKENIE